MRKINIATMNLLPGARTTIRVGWRKYIEVRALSEFEAKYEIESNKAMAKAKAEIGDKLMGLGPIIEDEKEK